MPKSNAVLSPNLGLYFDRPLLAVPQRGVSSGLNFRIRDGKVNNLNLGWTRFENFVLNGPVLMIDLFFPVTQNLVPQLIFGTATDLYLYNSTSHAVTYLTPRYGVGTVTAAGVNVTGVGTSWLNVAAHIRPGDELIFADQYNLTTGAWFVIDHVVDDTHLVLTTSAGVVGATNYTIRRKFSGGPSTVWSTSQFSLAATSGKDEWWATNGVDNIVMWDTAKTQVDDEFAGLVMGFTAKTLFNINNQMIYVNLIQGGTRKLMDMINSDIGDPRDVTTGLSEQFRVHSGTDEVWGLGQIGDNLVLYSKYHVVIGQFVGDPLVWAFRAMGSNNGSIGPKAFVDMGAYHLFLGTDAQYIFDGVNIKEINNHVWREVLRTQDPQRIQHTYTHIDTENAEVLWSIPLTTDAATGTQDGAPDKAYVNHYLETVPQGVPTPHSVRSFPFTATGFYIRQDTLTWDQLTQAWNTLNFRWNDQFFAQAFPFNMAGDATGKIFTFNSSQDGDGVALPSNIILGRRPLGDGKERGLLRRVYPWMTKFTNPVNITTRMMDFATGPATISDTKSFDQSQPEGQHFTSHLRRGRYTELQVGTAGPGQPWELHGFDIDPQGGGHR